MLKKHLLLLLLVLSGYATQGQSIECSPYFTIPKYELSKSKSAGIAYVSCIHARGVSAEVGYDKAFIGIVAMGKKHHNASYIFLQYEHTYKRITFFAGPTYRINNNPQFVIGRAGIDYQIYKRIYLQAFILQINPQLNYANLGIKTLL